jgi:transposase
VRPASGGGVSAQIIELPRRTSYEPELSKTQIARHYGYSRRWIEMQVAAGAPSRKLPNGHRRFRLSAFDDWLKERRRAQ